VFSFGRTRQILGPGHKARTRPVSARHEQIAFIPAAHPGYITLAAFDANQARLAECATAHGADRKAGPPREGPALLQGIIVCGRCGRRMTVRYHLAHDGAELPTYVCQHDKVQNSGPDCQTIPGAGIDTAIGHLLVDTLTPLALETAFVVADELAARADDADRLRATTVQRAQYHAEQARRRYLAVDPTNRLVADALEADWNNALRELAEATDAYERAKATAATLPETQRQRITALAADFPTLWNNPATPLREHKRMVRLLIEDVTIRRDKIITVHIRLKGGQHHTLTLPLPLASWQLRKTPPDVVAAIDDLLN
jgi:Recombinase zinc beta ribbon domain